MISSGIHYSTGSLNGMRHLDPECSRLKGRKTYLRIDSDYREFPFDQKWCSICSPSERAECEAALAEFRRMHS